MTQGEQFDPIPAIVRQALRLPRAEAVAAMRWLAEQPTMQPSVRIAARVALKHLLPKPAAQAENGR
jgi:hypothetical protein